ncbi:MAG: hypothetical protein OSB47_09760 [Pirellulaceae bacterium]|nr:hypothetical protein [Pirellulaceae bacterium]
MNKPEVRNNNAIGSVQEASGEASNGSLHGTTDHFTGLCDRVETVLVHSIIPADVPENKQREAIRNELIREIAQRRDQGI